MATGNEVTGPINLGNPAEFTIAELAEHVLRLTGSRAGIEYLPLPADDPARRRPDISVANAVLGWQPTVPLEKGLGPAVDYFRKLTLQADTGH
jgi:UDP-glucuronate decarboxylase